MDSEVFALNNAVDELWKKELDSYRKKQEAHPLLATSTNKAIPFGHDQLYNWQNYKQGIRFIDKLNQFELYGVIDDILINDKKELIIIDYKSTSNPLKSLVSPYTLIGRYKQSKTLFIRINPTTKRIYICNKAFLILN
jgi:ATP-dependent exoDNAse (exonuclease V) beta subunit